MEAQPPTHAQSLAGLVERLLALSDDIHQAEGAITPEQEAELDALHMGVALKAEATAAACLDLETQAEACDDATDKYLRRAARLRARAGLLKGRLLAALEAAGVDRAVGPTGGAQLRYANPKVEIPNDDAVPDDFRELVRPISRAKIAEALRAGRELSFARFVRTRYLQWVR